MTKPMKPCDVYLRVSRTGGRENLISPEEQEQRARQLAKDYGLRVGQVITDLDESGAKWERPGLQLALGRVREGRSGGVIVGWLDRLTRDSEHAQRILRELTAAGGAIYAPDAPANAQTAEGGLQYGILFEVAQYQRRRIAERSRRDALIGMTFDNFETWHELMVSVEPERERTITAHGAELRHAFGRLGHPVERGREFELPVRVRILTPR